MTHQMQNLKSKIIVSVLDKLDGKDVDIFVDLNEFAKHYHVNLKARPLKMDLKKALRMFIVNDIGYNETINYLYTALK